MNGGNVPNSDNRLVPPKPRFGEFAQYVFMLSGLLDLR